MNFYLQLCQSIGGGLIGGFAGGCTFHVLRTVFWPAIRQFRGLRRDRKAFGGLPHVEVGVAGFDDGLPPDADRRAFGQMLAYLVELGPLADPIQREAHAVIRQRARGQEYVLTPEVARWLILMAGVSPPNIGPVWDLIDEACDVLGQEHLERSEET